MAHRTVLIAAATRPYPTEVMNGDAWQVDWYPAGCRITVVDGLGHGPEAAAAAAHACAALATSPNADPPDALRRCHEALRDTRGAAIGIAAIEPAMGRLIYAGVGNVEARLVAGGQAVRLPSARGIVGAVLPTIRPISTTLAPEWLLVIHSDGVSDRFDLDEVMMTLTTGASDPQQLADLMVARWGRSTDDATVVVARPAPSVGRDP